MGKRRPWVPQRSARSASHVKLDLKCRACGGDNYAKHKFCGWCGVEMGAPVPVGRRNDITDVDTSLASVPGIPGIGGDTTFPGQPNGEPTTPGSVPTPASEDATVMHALPNVGSVPGDGLTVTLLGEASGKTSRNRTQPVLYRLELGEPFDVDGPAIESPGTFTATVEGLRLDSLGSLEGVYRRVSRDEKPVAYRRLRVIRELGTFQALAPGETIPLGALAILDRVLVRIEPN